MFKLFETLLGKKKDQETVKNPDTNTEHHLYHEGVVCDDDRPSHELPAEENDD